MVVKCKEVKLKEHSKKYLKMEQCGKWNIKCWNYIKSKNIKN